MEMEFSYVYLSIFLIHFNRNSFFYESSTDSLGLFLTSSFFLSIMFYFIFLRQAGKKTASQGGLRLISYSNWKTRKIIMCLVWSNYCCNLVLYFIGKWNFFRVFYGKCPSIFYSALSWEGFTLLLLIYVSKSCMKLLKLAF